jgi:hypothetical protein
MLSPTRIWFPLRSNIDYARPERITADCSELAKQAFLLLEEIWFERGGVAAAVHPDAIWRLSTDRDLGEDDDPDATGVRLSGAMPAKLNLEVELNRTGFNSSDHAQVVELLPKVELAALAVEAAIEVELPTRTQSLLETQIREDLAHDIARAHVIDAALAVNEAHAAAMESVSEQIAFPALRLDNTPWPRLVEIHGDHRLQAYRAAVWDVAESRRSAPEAITDLLHGLELLFGPRTFACDQQDYRLVIMRPRLAESRIEPLVLTMRRATRSN